MEAVAFPPTCANSRRREGPAQEGPRGGLSMDRASGIMGGPPADEKRMGSEDGRRRWSCCDGD